jgi:hypothetical protein
MDMLEARKLAPKIIAQAVKETDHSKLKEGDLVYCGLSTKCLKIMSLNNGIAIVSDKEQQWPVSVTALASDEAVRVNTYLALYGDRCIFVSRPAARGEAEA